jgi:serine protease Do
MDMRRNAVAWAALILSTAAIVSSNGLLRPVPAAPRISTESQKTARALSEAFGAVADYVKPSVVQIGVTKKAGANPLRRNPRVMPFPMPGPNGPGGQGGVDPKQFEEMLKRFFGPEFRPEKEQFGLAEGTGSGFVYDDKGHIVTNNHVVSGADKITVTFYDGVEVSATVVGTDPQSDVAVIKVENTSYRPLPRGTSGSLKVGELVMAFGSPFGLSQTVTTGIISATERNSLHLNGRDSYESFLQTDAPINPGNSGGPLVNIDGQVIGVNSAIVTGGHGNDGVGFAIPIDLASSVADSLIKNGKVSRARIGIQLGEVTPALAKQFGVDPKTKGVLVAEVLPGSPAEKAGLKSGDIIVGYDDKAISSAEAFRMTVAAKDVGKPFNVRYFRDGKEHSTEITPAPADKVVFAIEKDGKESRPEGSKPESAKTELEGFGMEVQPLTPELAAQFGHSKELKGLLVADVKEGGPAEAAHIQPGDVITKVVKDHKIQPVPSAKEFKDFLSKSDEIAVYVQSSANGGVGRFETLAKAKK